MPYEPTKAEQARQRIENAVTDIQEGLEQGLTLDRVGALAISAEVLLSALAWTYNEMWDESERAGVVNVRITRRIQPPKNKKRRPDAR